MAHGQRKKRVVDCSPGCRWLRIDKFKLVCEPMQNGTVAIEAKKSQRARPTVLMNDSQALA